MSIFVFICKITIIVTDWFRWYIIEVGDGQRHGSGCDWFHFWQYLHYSDTCIFYLQFRFFIYFCSYFWLLVVCELRLCFFWTFLWSYLPQISPYCCAVTTQEKMVCFFYCSSICCIWCSSSCCVCCCSWSIIIISSSSSSNFSIAMSVQSAHRAGHLLPAVVNYFTCSSSSHHCHHHRQLWAQCPLVSDAIVTIAAHRCLYRAAWLNSCRVAPHHCSMSSDHSRWGRPLLFEPAIIPNTRVFIFLLSFILQICPKRCNFLCITFCSRVYVNWIFLYNSSLVTFCVHPILRIFRYRLP